jgi:hydroxymethylpyrimidine pyrophosphatase-like HAD family hydrolase
VRDIIVDLDGTVADCSHRQHYVNTKPSNWQAFEAGIPHDAPHQHVIDLVNTLYKAGWTIILCSGRGEQSRRDTESWLSRHGVNYHRLYMRAAGDYRRDDIVKMELLDQILAEGYNPSFALDDRDQVVVAWRSRGIPCFQVAPGDF